MGIHTEMQIETQKIREMIPLRTDSTDEGYEEDHDLLFSEVDYIITSADKIITNYIKRHALPLQTAADVSVIVAENFDAITQQPAEVEQ